MAEEEELEGVPKEGDVIIEKYRVERVLGVGGMGCVVAAHHLTLDTHVAIKFLLAKAAKNPKNILRFQREAQAAARIKSDHVAKVSDVGTMPETNTPYMVMEYLEGEDLSQRLERGAVAPHEAVDYVLQAAEALAEAHQAGIIHRDLKPANLFLTHTSDGKPRIKVLDFGISKIVDGAGNDLTKTSALMGSPLYMSPEQMMSAKAADARADIWALGCILFEAITCQPPFVGETLPEICSRILTNPPAKLTMLAPHAPHELESVIERALTKSPDERFQMLAEMADALAPFASSRGARSVNTVRRVQGLPELPQYAGVTTAPNSAIQSAVAHAVGAHGASSHGASQNPPQPYGAQTTGAPVTGPHQAMGTGPHQAVGTGPHQAMGTGPYAVASAHTANTPLPGHSSSGSTSDMDGASQQAVMHAIQQGASTGAPVAQTFDGMPPRRSKAPIFIGLALLLMGGGAAAVVFGLGGSTAESADQAAVTASAEPAASEEPVAEAPDEPETAPEPSAEPKPSAEPATAAIPPKQPFPRRPPRRFRDAKSKPPAPVKPPPKAEPKTPPPPPAPKRRRGGVRKGDDKFNTF